MLFKCGLASYKAGWNQKGFNKTEHSIGASVLPL